MNEKRYEEILMDPTRPLPFWESIRRDIYTHTPRKLRGESFIKRFPQTVFIILLSRQFHVLLLYRMAHTLKYRLPFGKKILPYIIGVFQEVFFGCSISPLARLSRGVLIAHPHGVIITAHAIVKRSWIFQNVTLGKGRKEGSPSIGEGCTLYAGAVIAGSVTVGDGTVIGANTVITSDIPAGAVVTAPKPEIRLK